MKKSLRESENILQLKPFLLKPVKITGELYFVLLMDDEASLESAVGSFGLEKSLPLLNPTERISCFLLSLKL